MAALMRVTCPECGAGLKADDPAGFEIGQALECPKCETYFAVEIPRAAAVAKPVAKAKKSAIVVEIEDDDRLRKKRRRDYDDEEVDRPRKKRKPEEGGYTRYRKSPIRFSILGVLIVVLIVMAVLLKMKWDREKQDQTSVKATNEMIA